MRNWYFAILSCGLLCGIGGCDGSEQVRNDNKPDAQRTANRKITLALDWSPNVLHAPLFWAEAKGYFSEAGLEISWFSTEVDNYNKKPIQRLLDGEVDLCIGPSEHLFFLAVDSTGQARAEAVATILQKDMSCFVAKANRGWERPRDLGNATYLGYKTPLEKRVLADMIAEDGGTPQFQMITPGRLDVWEAFLQDRGDVAWVFSHWEAAWAAHYGIDLHKFYPGDFGVPYGYSSVIMARKQRSDTMDKSISDFLQILARSVAELRAEEPSRVAKLLSAHVDHSNFNDSGMIERAWRDIAPAFIAGDSTRWGYMEHGKWNAWQTWMTRLGQGETPIDTLPPVDTFFTNRLIGR